MTDESLELACEVMSEYINSKDPIGYTKDALMNSLGLDEETATELANEAYKEWLEAYSG